MEQAAKSIACGTQALSLFRGLFVYPAMGFNPWRRGRGETPCRSARPYKGNEEQEDRQALRRIKSGIDFARLRPARIFIWREPGKPGTRWPDDTRGDDARPDRSPDGAKRNPGFFSRPQLPDFASLHPGYEGHAGCLTIE